MSTTTPGRKNPSDVGQSDKYDELELTLLYSSPHEELGVEAAVDRPDIEARPPTPFDEPVTTADGQELVAGNYARERSAEMDAQYRATAAPYETGHASDDEEGGADEDEDDDGPFAHIHGETGQPGGTFADVEAVENGQSLGAVIQADVGDLYRESSPGQYWTHYLADTQVQYTYPKVEEQAPSPEPMEQYSLAAEERIRGMHEEQERQRAKAVAAEAYGGAVPADDGETRFAREGRTRSGVVKMERIERDHFEAVATVHRAESRGRDPKASLSALPTAPQEPPVGRLGDPRSEMEQETLAAVNKAAARLAEHFDGELAMRRSGLGLCLAQRVAKGAGIASALHSVKEGIEGLSTVKQDLRSIDPYVHWETTVEIEVSKLWQPSNGAQRQAGRVTDGSTAYDPKFVIWFNSGPKPTLHEGDRVRFERIKVDTYKEQLTLAVTGDTKVTVLEQGDGPARRLKRQSDEPQVGDWRADSRTHSWVGSLDMERAVAVTRTAIARRRQDRAE